MRLLFTFLFILSFSFIQSQVVVSETKINVLYRGIDNPVDIAVSGWKSGDLIISLNADHQLIEAEDNSYIIRPANSLSTTVDVLVQGKKSNGKIVDLGTQSYRVKDLPALQIVWSGKTTNGIISPSEVLSFSPVIANFKDFDFDASVSVQGFTMRTHRDGMVRVFSSTTNQLTPEIKSELRKLKVGDLIFIEDIKANMPDGTTRRLSGHMLRVAVFDPTEYFDIRDYLYRGEDVDWSNDGDSIMVHNETGNPITGVVISKHYDEGWIHIGLFNYGTLVHCEMYSEYSESHETHINTDGTGYFKSYHWYEVLESMVLMEKGKKHGDYTKFDYNGNVKSSGQFNYGHRVGTWLVYYSKGPFAIFFGLYGNKTSNTKETETIYDTYGQIKQVTYFRKNGTIDFIDKYPQSEDVLRKTTTYKRNGEIKFEYCIDFDNDTIPCP